MEALIPGTWCCRCLFIGCSACGHLRGTLKYSGRQKGTYSCSLRAGTWSTNLWPTLSQTLLLGIYNLGQWCQTARWSQGSFGSSEGASSGGHTAKAFSPNQSYGVILAVFLAAWPPLTPLYFPSSSSLPFLLLFWVPYLFSNNFPFCQVSHIGFYCLHPMILILVHCFWPWSWSPDLVNSLSTVSRDAFQSYFCIILKISSSRWSVYFIILYILSNSIKCVICSLMKWNYVPSERSLSLHLFPLSQPPRFISCSSFLFTLYSFLLRVCGI